jgi:hypothetical protein
MTRLVLSFAVPNVPQQSSPPGEASLGIVTRLALSFGAAVLIGGCSASQLPVASPPIVVSPLGSAKQMTFHYTGKKQTFKVPRGVTHIRVVAVGAGGGGVEVARGGRVSAVIPVTPSERLAIYVGGAGASLAGGFNGGADGGTIPTTDSGTSGYGGGGASDVREGGTALTDRVIVAGGGGGQGIGPAYGNRNSKGGKGGALTGGSGKDGCCRHFQNGGHGGTGGTQDQGGTGGAGPQNAGENGQLAVGGGGASGCGGTESCGYDGGNGGGGGGGLYGGGGGGGGMFFGCCGAGGGGGGGGGSSYAESSATDVHMWRGWKSASADGLVVLSWK